MTKDYYKPRNDGVAGLEDFGDIEHGTHYERLGRVFRDGEQVVGYCTEPTLVAEYLARGGTITHGPVCIAKGAHRFTPGWDYRLSSALAQTAVYRDAAGNYHEGRNGTRVTSRDVVIGIDE